MNTVILWYVTPCSLVDTEVNSHQGGMQEQQWDDTLAVEVYHFNSHTGQSVLLCIITQWTLPRATLSEHVHGIRQSSSGIIMLHG
jgi:hypothetical protein